MFSAHPLKNYPTRRTFLMKWPGLTEYSQGTFSSVCDKSQGHLLYVKHKTWCNDGTSTYLLGLVLDPSISQTHLVIQTPYLARNNNRRTGFTIYEPSLWNPTSYYPTLISTYLWDNHPTPWMHVSKQLQLFKIQQWYIIHERINLNLGWTGSNRAVRAWSTHASITPHQTNDGRESCTASNLEKAIRGHLFSRSLPPMQRGRSQMRWKQPDADGRMQCNALFALAIKDRRPHAPTVQGVHPSIYATTARVLVRSEAL